MELFGKRLLVKKNEQKETKVGSIIIPGIADEKQPVSGTVLHRSNGYWENGTRIDMPIEVGDTVLFFAQAGIDMRIGEEDLFLIDVDKILARM